MKGTPFSPRAILLLAAAALGLFALSVLLEAYGEPEIVSPEGRAGPGSKSVSALGYSGLYGTLEQLDWDVDRDPGNPLLSDSPRAWRDNDDGALVVAEPNPDRLSQTRRTIVFKVLPRVLLVLPKWEGAKDRTRTAWIAEAGLLPEKTVLKAMNLADIVGDVAREPWPRKWTTNAVGVEPSGTDMVQLLRSSAVRTLVGTDDGALLGEVEFGDRRLLILSDPDVMSNHGIGRGDNLPFMLAVLDRLARDDDGWRGQIVFDDSVRGGRQGGESILAMLFRFPFVVATLLLCAAAVVIWLAGANRFGPPLRRESAADFGKAKLIDNSARLLAYTNNQAPTLRRYLSMTVRTAAQGLHAPDGLEGDGLVAWLDRVGKARGVSASCAEILRRADGIRAHTGETAPRLARAARDIHRWKGEILHGSGQNRPNDPNHPDRGSQGHNRTDRGG